MEHGDAEAKLLVTRYLPGQLVLGSDHSDDPSAFQQAGELLALFHAQAAVADHDYEMRENEKALAWLSGPHRITAPVVARLRAQIAAWPTPPATLMPTHGDWQPRNWLIRNGIVSVIDFGRAAMRPALTDFARLAAQDFRRDPNLEAAFLDGYGPDPRTPETWYRTRGSARRTAPPAGPPGGRRVVRGTRPPDDRGGPFRVLTLRGQPIDRAS